MMIHFYMEPESDFVLKPVKFEISETTHSKFPNQISSESNFKFSKGL